MTRVMPIPALLQAISRLDQAVSRVETALETAQGKSAPGGGEQKERVRQAIAELDGLIDSLKKGGAHG